MRTTIDIPDSLFREVKARAAYEGKKMKELINGYIEVGLQAPVSVVDSQEKVPPPPIVFKADSTKSKVGPFTNAELFQLLEEEDLQKSSK